MPTLHRSFAALTVAMLAAAPALAQQTDTPPAQQTPETTRRDSVTIGAGVATIPQYEGSGTNKTVAVPLALASVHGFNFTLIGNQATLDLIPNRPGPTWDIQFGPVGVYDMNRDSLKHIDNSRVRALGKLKDAIELGGFVGIGKTGVLTSPYDKLSVAVSYRHDVSGVHDSGIWSPSFSYFTPLSLHNAVSLTAGANHADRGYAQTYYGVTSGQSAASGLPVYSPRGGWKDWNISLLGTQSITGDLRHGLKIVAGGVYRQLLGDFGRSPVTEKKAQWTGAAGLAYTF